MTDSELLETFVTKTELSNHGKRVTVGEQETFAQVLNVTDILKGAAGTDDNQIHQFKDRVWANQQKLLACIQGVCRFQWSKGEQTPGAQPTAYTLTEREVQGTVWGCGACI